MCWSLMPRSLGWAGLISAALLSSAISAQATTWDRITRYLSLIKEAGIEEKVKEVKKEAARAEILDDQVMPLEKMRHETRLI